MQATENPMTSRRCLCVLALAACALGTGVRPAAADEQKTVTLAHIKLSGSLSEAPPASDPLFGTTAENFKSKLDRIKKARNDDSIQGLYLEIEGLTIGYGKIDELRRAVADFRKSGKKAYAYLQSADAKDYLVGAACDQVALPESGWLMLVGVRAEVTFYKDLFDMIGVKADMLQMGAYKGAAEPFTRSSMSKEFHAQYEGLINDFYEHGVVGATAASRPKLTADEVKKLIDDGPFSARQAAKAGLIDHVAYPSGFQDDIKESLKADRLKISKDYGKAKAKAPALTDLFDLAKLFAPPTTPKLSKPGVAVVYATGVIVTGKSAGSSLLGEETCGSTTMVEAIKQAEEDPNVKAIVLRVDSPGGSALASDLIWHELARSKKPVIASMSDVAASGGYYISMAAGKIYAEPDTLTGSIGVVGGKFALGGLEKKIGLNTETISRGANATLLSTSRPFTESERKVFGSLMRETYDLFLDKALEGRKKAGKTLTKEKLENDLAGGRVWTGRQAKEHGLVDELGTLNDAIAAAWKAAGQPETKEPELLTLPRPRDLFDELQDMISGTDAPGSRALLRQVPGLQERLGTLGGMLRLRGEPVWLLVPYQVEVR
jgi:protease-4